ncbi:MAG: acylphosphatase [Chloroflexota bacterium]|nr:acylphosphatase [Chloroflexota bacterium]
MEQQAEVRSLRAMVSGRVQGVNFRDFVWRRANFLGVRGYVRNLPDMRSVEVVAEGERGKLEQLLEYLREGPRGARVNTIDVQWGEASGRFTRFGVAF